MKIGGIQKETITGNLDWYLSWITVKPSNKSLVINSTLGRRYQRIILNISYLYFIGNINSIKNMKTFVGLTVLYCWWCWGIFIEPRWIKWREFQDRKRRVSWKVQIGFNERPERDQMWDMGSTRNSLNGNGIAYGWASTILHRHVSTRLVLCVGWVVVERTDLAK